MGDDFKFVQSCLLLAWAIAHVPQASASLVGAAVLPHGDFAFDPSQLSGIGSANEFAQAKALNRGTMEAANFIAGLKADVLVLTTPHGLQTSWNWAFYGNSQLRGHALVGRDLEESFVGSGFPRYEVPLVAKGAPEFAAAVVSALAAQGANVTLLKGWNDVLPQELHWGEVLPLELLRRAYRGSLPPTLVVGLPLSRYNYSSLIAKDTLEMGRLLGRELGHDEARRVAFVVSTDLAHRHWSNTSFGFSPDAKPFDTAMGKWATSLDSSFLLGSETLSKVDHIYSCGFLGMVLLQGVLEGAGGDFTAHLSAAPTAPTYYGMMAASFARHNEQEEERSEARTVGSVATRLPGIVV